MINFIHENIINIINKLHASFLLIIDQLKFHINNIDVMLIDFLFML